MILARPRPRFYKKGPDVGSKADRTQRRYKDLLTGQQMLEDFGFMPAEPQSRLAASPSPCPSLPTTTSSGHIDQTITDDDRNFANLHLKGYGRIEASFEIA